MLAISAVAPLWSNASLQLTSSRTTQPAVQQRIARLEEDLARVLERNVDGDYDQWAGSLKAKLARIRSTEQKRATFTEAFDRADYATHKLTGELRIARAWAWKADSSQGIQVAEDDANSEKKPGGDVYTRRLKARLAELRTKNHDGRHDSRVRRLESKVASRLRELALRRSSHNADPPAEPAGEPVEPLTPEPPPAFWTPVDPAYYKPIAYDPLQPAAVPANDVVIGVSGAITPSVDDQVDELAEKLKVLAERFKELSQKYSESSDRLHRLAILSERFDRLIGLALSGFDQDPRLGAPGFAFATAAQLNVGLKIVGLGRQILKGIRETSPVGNLTPLDSMATWFLKTASRLHIALEALSTSDELAALRLVDQMLQDAYSDDCLHNALSFLG